MVDAESEAKRAWNAEADQYNQWTELGQDEKDELVAEEKARRHYTVPGVDLPEFWRLDSMPGGEIVIQAHDSVSDSFLGAVSVNEVKRNFSLGAVTVRSRGEYSGRGWKERLYADAVKHLKASFEE